MLPVMFTGVIWMVPEAVWEPEPLPPPPPSDVLTGGDTEAPQDGASSNGACAISTQTRLVFKGYLYEMRVRWQYADTPLSTPWQPDDVDEAERRNRKPAPVAPPPVVEPTADLAPGPPREGSSAADAGVDPR